MKVAIGSKIMSGPWGGGNNFVKNLSKYLEEKDCSVVYDLKDKNIDIILLTDPRIKSQSSSFNHIDIYNYINKIYSKAIIVHRINECDERKSTSGINSQLVFANNFSDYTVFISTWLSQLFTHLKIFKHFKIICNGANKKIFFNKNKPELNEKKIKLVTHHWSNHINKGFDTYKMIDERLGNNQEFKKKVEFSIIGNMPKNLKFKNINHIEPLSGLELADAIRANDIYITGSKFEPGGNHQNEAINCGLPILYQNSGCMKEYCDGFGEEYNKENLFEKLENLTQKYSYYQKKTHNYRLNSEFTCSNYYHLFKDLMDRKKEILQERKWPKIPYLKILNHKIERLLF